MTQDQKTPKPGASSGPTAPARRFLAQLMEYSFREGWRTPDDFVKHFPAQSMMAALKSAPELRVAILAAATGIYEEILRRKSPALAAEDLSLALDEGTTSSMQLLAAFSPEDRVRYLDPRKIWDFIAGDQFWRYDPEATDEQRQAASERMSHTLSLAVQERLLTLRDILEGLTYEAVADSLSPDELRAVVRHALLKGRDGIGLSEKVLLEVLPLDKLLRSMPLEHIWNEVVLRRIAIPSGLTDLNREERRESQPERPPSEPRRSSRPSVGPPPLPLDLVRPAVAQVLPEARSAPPQNAPNFFQNAEAAQYVPAAGNGYAPPPAAPISGYTEDDDELTTAAPSVGMREGSLLPPPMARSSAPPSSPGSAPRALTDDFNQPLPPPRNAPPPPSTRAPGSQPMLDAQDGENMDRQRQRVTEHLRAIGRLPPRHATMPAGVLRSIDAMYALLPSATDDIQRKSVIRQAFANDNHLRVALLGLIELMDSSVDTSDPVIQEAKIDALIKILLFEEQRRKENGRFPSTPFGARSSSSLPPGSSPVASGSVAGGFNARAGEGYYFPSSGSRDAGFGTQSLGTPSRVPTQRPPGPVLSNAPYAAGSGPLPNLPADPLPARRRTTPPPLPPSYPRG
ncbi:MAG TPA: hypothetical protein VNN80_11800 [Polyangiaceae bacterium]|nr:hypothetical protein [Polyangiaceae bacterium]